MNFAVIIYFYLKFRRKINTNIDHYLLILNILDQRVTEYKKMYAIYKQKLNKQYQIDNPTITFNKESYTKCLQQYVNNLVRNLLQEFSRESRNELLHIFSEEGLIRYITDRILE
jgi:HD superfamily phosphodiesterase